MESAKAKVGIYKIAEIRRPNAIIVELAPSIFMTFWVNSEVINKITMGTELVVYLESEVDDDDPE
jgi:hypothetical protein